MDELEDYLNESYYRMNQRARPRPEPVIPPQLEVRQYDIEEPIKIKKQNKKIDVDDYDDTDDIINVIISKKPNIKLTRKLLKKYIEIKEEEDEDF